MKKVVLFLFCIIAFNKTNAQVVFCPPGAEWHSLWSGTIFMPGNTYNEMIKYVGDSISGSDTIKFLTHNEFYATCGPKIHKTLIKQRGDTVFFYNQLTQGTWQILYNFAAMPGQSWQTTVVKNTTANITFTFTVQSVGTVTINGLNLKELTVTATHWAAGTKITERIGSNSFLFNFSHRSPGSCDGNVFMGPLCYRDNIFGTTQFSDKSCYYYTSNYVGINEEKMNDLIKIYPNPANNLLTIEKSSDKESEISLMDIFGREVKNAKLQGSCKIDLSSLNKGIYFIVISKNAEPFYKTKIIKE